LGSLGFGNLKKIEEIGIAIRIRRAGSEARQIVFTL
jgi:hypothetical protein